MEDKIDKKEKVGKARERGRDDSRNITRGKKGKK